MTRTLAALIVGVWLLGTGSAARASGITLYGTTGAGGFPGELVTLDPTSGAVLTSIGALRDASGGLFGLTGLVFDSDTGLLYGSTTRQSPTARNSLVLVDPATAIVTVIGPFGAAGGTMADLAFDPVSRVLFGSENVDANLYRIDELTGAASLVGVSGVAVLFGGGLAASGAGVLYGTPEGSEHDLFTYDETTGVATSVATLTGAPFTTNAYGRDAINALAFDPNGILFGVNIDLDPLASVLRRTRLVTIDTATGVVTDLGESLVGLDAIAFWPPARDPMPVPEPASVTLLALGLAVVVGLRRRRPGHRAPRG